MQLVKCPSKKDLNTLNELKNTEITKQRKRTPKQKEILNLFNILSDIILTDKTLESKSQEDTNENENVNENENEKVNENENDKTLMSSKNDNDENDNENKNENEDDETMSQNEKSEIIKETNDFLDEIIDKSK